MSSTDRTRFSLTFETVIADPEGYAELKLFMEEYHADRLIHFLQKKYGFHTTRGWEAHELVAYFKEHYRERQG